MKCVHVYCDFSPSLTDPALLSVVGFVDGQVTVLSCLVLSRKKKIHLQSFLPFQSTLVSTSDWHRPDFLHQSALVQASLLLKHQPTGQLKRTWPLWTHKTLPPKKRKRCYDITLSRQKGSTMRHLASAQYWGRPAGGDTGRLFLAFGGPVCADRNSNCPLD